MDNLSFGAALEYLQKEFDGHFQELESLVATSTTAAQAVPNNPDRLGLLIVNVGGDNVTLGLKQGVTASNGVLLAANGGSMSLDVREDFTLVTREWFAIATANTPNLYVLQMNRPISNAMLAKGAT